MFREFAQGHPRRDADGGGWRVAFRQRQKLGIAPHVEGAAGKGFAADLFLERVVVERDFQGRKAVFAEGPRGIAPGLAAFFASQFVEIGHVLPSRWHAGADCTRSVPESYVGFRAAGREMKNPPCHSAWRVSEAV